ncbi:hypothetical protein CNMCM5623_005547 [Aspergillus felis]|uniref:37S ribosomal protein Rsm22 n=1 Tax=Aspergillus felis TaxID=1287682 RepID=A0A8H6PSM9_9EURO|nr:hypothetical protein CNMCM5623_005547 [Aspergillus felis]
MATWAYPPLPPDSLEQEADSALDSLAALREGLRECAALLAPKEPGSTLVLSSHRSESVKGYVTRVGTKVVKGDIQLRLSSLASARGTPTTRLCVSNAPGAPELVLKQLSSVRDLVNQSLDVVDVSTWTGDPLDASFIFGQLHLLHETIMEARHVLKGENDNVQGKWWETSAEDNIFDPPLPPDLSFHLSIADSALVLYLRTLETTTPSSHAPTAFATDLSLTGFNIRDRLFGPRHRPHDEMGDIFVWKGEEVKVKEKIRVESQDPSLMAVMAKLSALEHEVMKWLTSLKVLMGTEDTDIYNSPRTASQQLRCGAATCIAQRLKSTLSRRAPSHTSHTILFRSTSGNSTERWQIGRRHVSSNTPSDTHPYADRKDTVYALIDKINENELELAELMDDLGLLEEYQGVLNLEGPELEHVFSQTIGYRDEQALESRVRTARQEFGEYLPAGYLNETELRLYTRLYGEPIIKGEEPQSELEADLAEEDRDSNRLFQEDGQGGWKEVEFAKVESQDDGPPLVYDMEVGPPEEESAAMRRTREVAEQLGGELMLEQFEDEAVPDATPRLHPLTREGKFSTDPSTVFLPKDTVTGPISVILSEFSNRHIADVAHRTFGGRLLPHSTTTPPPRAQVPQLPIPLEASQRHMSQMEGNVYMAALYPGMYASALSVLVEVRKRLGTDWIRRLIAQEGGPNVLDAGAGGAGILAWRDVLRAEWEAMVPDHPETDPIPLGRSTVITASEALRSRASVMLDNTTFLPRLPDYVHIREKPTLDDQRPPPPRKQYDVIIAPHTLLGLEEEYMRKEHVENLWTLLNPNGGVLILLEKGHQKGFEAIAGAREMLLKRYISSPGSTQYEELTESSNASQHIDKEEGMIIAPCTNHAKCPMYTVAGRAEGRRDFCHFEQRYIRPAFLQRILGAKDRNHEDVKFSYIAVQRGVDLRKEMNIVQGPEAAEAAFAGYEHLHDMEAEDGQVSDDAVTSEPSAAQNGQDVHALSLPRAVYTPMKRRGHVIFDLCTPAGKIERWTVPRSYSKQAYKDARKARWGDLWALGAKTRIPRSLRLGEKHGEGKKERLAKRAASKAALGGSEDGALETTSSDNWDVFATPVRKKGQTIPSWKKHQDKKKIRQASKKQSTAKLTDNDLD